MKTIQLHPVTPQKRHMATIARVLDHDGILIFPTDSGYTMGCSALSKKAVRRLYQLKRPSKKYNMTLMFRNFSPVSEFAHLDNHAFKFMKHLVPGPYTFILPATNKGRKLLEVNRPEMGVRIPDHPFLQSLQEDFDGPLLSTSARVNDGDTFTVPDEIQRIYSTNVDLILDSGPLPQKPTTIISLTGGAPEVLRLGAGPVSF